MGKLLYQVVRYDPKDFRQRRPDGRGGWEWSVRGVRQVPYRLPELLKRPDGAPVYICEGEKDADRLAALGFIATTNAGAAGKWRPEFAEHLRGAKVYVLPNADDAGRNHAGQVAASLYGIAAEVRIVTLPGLAAKEDVSDWLDRGGTVDVLAKLCAAAPPWTLGEADAASEDDGDAALVPHDIEDLDQGEIPPRQWLLSTLLCRRFVTLLAAAGAAERIIALIRRLDSDVVMLDPYVKLANGNENDNRAADFLARILVRIAIKADVAVLVAHHTRKGPADAGNIDAARGARAIIDAARLALTLRPMSSDEAKNLNVAEDERRRLVRLDDGKTNLAPASHTARWYRLASVGIGNANEAYPSGDHIQAIERWGPPNF